MGEGGGGKGGKALSRDQGYKLFTKIGEEWGRKGGREERLQYREAVKHKANKERGGANDEMQIRALE